MVLVTIPHKSFHYPANFLKRKITSYWFEVFQKLCEEKCYWGFFVGVLAKLCTSLLNKLQFRKHLCSFSTAGMFRNIHIWKCCCTSTSQQLYLVEEVNLWQSPESCCHAWRRIYFSIWKRIYLATLVFQSPSTVNSVQVRNPSSEDACRDVCLWWL